LVQEAVAEACKKHREIIAEAVRETIEEQQQQEQEQQQQSADAKESKPTTKPAAKPAPKTKPAPKPAPKPGFNTEAPEFRPGAAEQELSVQERIKQAVSLAYQRRKGGQPDLAADYVPAKTVIPGRGQGAVWQPGMPEPSPTPAAVRPTLPGRGQGDVWQPGMPAESSPTLNLPYRGQGSAWEPTVEHSPVGQQWGAEGWGSSDWGGQESMAPGCATTCQASWGGASATNAVSGYGAAQDSNYYGSQAWQSSAQQQHAYHGQQATWQTTQPCWQGQQQGWQGQQQGWQAQCW